MRGNMHTFLRQLSIGGIIIALVASTLAIAFSHDTDATGGALSFSRVSPDSWGVPDSNIV